MKAKIARLSTRRRDSRREKGVFVRFFYRLFAVAAAIVAITAFSSSPSEAALPTTVYWGTYVDGAPFDMTKLTTYETRAKKKVSIVHWGSPWVNSVGGFYRFQTSAYNAVRAHGSIPFIDWGAYQQGYSMTNQPNFQNADIYGGKYDWYIRQWATDAKAWGKPLFLRPGWEMNGAWFPWGEGKRSGAIVNGNRAGDFVKMWRHMHDIFVSVGAKNVSWVWCPNIQSVSSDYPSYSSLYPGASYVDWTCLDGYNKYSGQWLNFQAIFKGVGTSSWLRNSYQMVLDLAPTKPLMIGETASWEAGDGGKKKGDWFKNGLLTELPYYMPKVKAYVYFNWNARNSSWTFPIETTSASLYGFQTGIASPYYAANWYGSLTTSPIPAIR
jgi:hypothetical protein